MPAYQQGKIIQSGGGQFGAAHGGQFAPARVAQNERRGGGQFTAAQTGYLERFFHLMIR